MALKGVNGFMGGVPDLALRISFPLVLIFLHPGKNADKVGIEAAEMLLGNLRHGGAVDDYLQDQVRTHRNYLIKSPTLKALSLVVLLYHWLQVS